MLKKRKIESAPHLSHLTPENTEVSNLESPEDDRESLQIERLEQEQRVEQSVVSGVEKLDGKVSGVRQAIEVQEKLLPPDKIRSLRERFNGALDRAAETAKFAVLVAVVANMPKGLRRSRLGVESKPEVDGTKIYRHPDQQTTEILNYMSGKAELSREQQLGLITDALSRMDSKNDTYAQLREAQESLKPRIFKDNLISPEQLARGKDSVSRHIYPIPTKEAFSPLLYETLWKMEASVGNPRIRWTMNEKNPRIRSEFQNRAFYRPEEHTMYLPSPISLREGFSSGDVFELGLLEDYTAEAAHALQWNRNRVDQDKASKRDWEWIRAQAILEGNDPKDPKFGEALGKIRDREAYRTPGFVEHEAHSKIEPVLWKQIKSTLSRLTHRRFPN